MYWNGVLGEKIESLDEINRNMRCIEINEQEEGAE